jgi:hypothetical protein
MNLHAGEGKEDEKDAAGEIMRLIYAWIFQVREGKKDINPLLKRIINNINTE